MVADSFLQHFILALRSSSQHAASAANAGMGYIATASNLCTGVHHHDYLVKAVS